MNKFLSTMAGSWLKVFAVAVLIKFMDLGGDIFAMNMENFRHLVQAGVIACIPVLINTLNPADPRYGINKIDNEKNNN